MEIHFNSSTNKTANGVECIALPKDKVLAQKLSAAVSKVTGSRLRREKHSRVIDVEIRVYDARAGSLLGAF